jgi:hypothetical protein
MFVLPALIWAVFLPSLKQGLLNPIPGYERALLETAVFCDSWKWLLALPVLGLGSLLFNMRKLTAPRPVGKQQIPHF